MTRYAERWDNPDSTAGQTLEYLWDLRTKTILPAICLPLPSYDLKHVVQYASFKQTQEDYGSLWSVVQYHKWLKAATEEERSRIAHDLLLYNKEDCKVMRYVLGWVRGII